MKKILAIILTAMMLLSVAMAEDGNVQFSLRLSSSMQLDKENISANLGEVVDPKLLSAIIDVVNGIKEESVIQMNGVQTKLYLNDALLFDEAVLLTDQEIALFTNILPEKKLTVDLLDERVQEVMKQLQKMIARLNIGQMADGLLESVMSWAETLKTEHVDGTVQRELLGACSNYDMMTITGNDFANLTQKLLDQNDIWNSIDMLLKHFGLEAESARKAAESAVQELRDSTYAVRMETMDNGNAGDFQIPDGNGKYTQIFTWRVNGNEMQLLLCVPQVSMFDSRYYLYMTQVKSEDLSKTDYRVSLLQDSENKGYEIVKDQPEALTAEMSGTTSMTAESIISETHVQIGADPKNSGGSVTTVTLSDTGLNADTDVLMGQENTRVASSHTAIEIVEAMDMQRDVVGLENISLLDLDTEENQQKLMESLQTGLMNILTNLMQNLPEEISQLLFSEQN